MGTAFWVIGGLVVLVLAVLVGDKATRCKVVRAISRRWEKRQARNERVRARQHRRSAKASASRMPQARTRFERPKQSRLRTQKCSAACRTSRKPAFHPKTGELLCDCPCGGREHGVYRKGSTATPKTRKGAAGSSGTKRVAAPPSTRPSTPSVPRAAGPMKPATTGTLTAPKPTAPPVRTVSRTAPPPKTKGLQVGTWERMRRHADQSPRCAGGTYSVQTITDRRTDPPKVSQEIKCDTCGRRV